MKINNILMIVAIVAVTFALVNLIIHYDDAVEFTGFATGQDTGTANVTILSQASVEFITNTIDWGLGSVNEIPTSALLVTNGTVDGGNWSAVSQALVLQNDGNTNISVTLTSTLATTFLGGTAVTPLFQLKVSDNETDSCDSAHNEMTDFTEVNGTAQNACLNLSYYNTFDTIKIDVQLRVPSDASPGIKGAVITAIATPI